MKNYITKINLIFVQLLKYKLTFKLYKLQVAIFRKEKFFRRRIFEMVIT